MVLLKKIAQVGRLAAALLLCAFALFEGKGWGEEIPAIRMVVADKVRNAIINVEGPFSVEGKQKVLLKGDSLDESRVTSVNGKIQVGGSQFPGNKVILAADSGEIRVGVAGFAPKLEIVSNGGDRLTIISILDLEEYTRGVMQKEMEPSWPMEALKAQAVLARSNAVHAYLKNKGKPFHLTRYSPQVYAHTAVAQGNIPEAIEETRGLILSYNDKVIQAYFHSVCGGGTEAAKNVWQQSAPYPAAVYCRYCEKAPKFDWSKRMRLKEVERKLNAAGLPVGAVRDIFASKVSAVSDRVTEVAIHHTQGKLILRTNALRSILGHDIIRSTNFTATCTGGDIVFNGHGWGHGVGLCQWGAREMAKQGKDFEEILNFYFPGARIVRVKE